MNSTRWKPFKLQATPGVVTNTPGNFASPNGFTEVPAWVPDHVKPIELYFEDESSQQLLARAIATGVPFNKIFEAGIKAHEKSQQEMAMTKACQFMSENVQSSPLRVKAGNPFR